MTLCGQLEQHCCWIDGEPCEHLLARVAGRRWACALFMELGDWSLVHADPRYTPQREALERVGSPVLCGDFPGPGQLCGDCGEVG